MAGAAAMLIDPSGRALGMDAMLPYFQVLPFAEVLFQNFIFSGWALLIVNGLSNLTAACLLLAKKKAGVVLGGIFGVTLMLWICIQFYIFPLNFMSTIYFLFGLCQAATGYAAWIFLRQESFRVDPADYPHIGADPRRLVVCFSRMGYVRKQALAEADRTGAAVYEIRAAERTAGTLGFWWCGRYGMHRWPMPIEPVALDLAAHQTFLIKNFLPLSRCLCFRPSEVSLTPPTACGLCGYAGRPCRFPCKARCIPQYFWQFYFGKSITFFLCCTILQAAVSRI